MTTPYKNKIECPHSPKCKTRGTCRSRRSREKEKEQRSSEKKRKRDDAERKLLERQPDYGGDDSGLEVRHHSHDPSDDSESDDGYRLAVAHIRVLKTQKKEKQEVIARLKKENKQLKEEEGEIYINQ